MYKLRIGDSSENDQITIIDEDRLCYIVRSINRNASGLRTISKALLYEFVNYLQISPSANPREAREALSGKSEIDKFEYGYESTLLMMAKMVLGKENVNHAIAPLEQSLQVIYYGAPGTGKSYSIKELTKEAEADKRVFRTTFHPDSDYATFVGCYKPTKVRKPVRDMAGNIALDKNKNEIYEESITYQFVPQAFTNAYVKAYQTTEPVYLVIEEINRGNCAQIFGDLFQLLDRDDAGYSKYPIIADTDLGNHIRGRLQSVHIEGIDEAILDGQELVLPSNLYILASMNTSDQSLFPIDSAFKRRWDWKYIPIEDVGKGYTIKVNGHEYDWWTFLEAINKEVFELTNSEDKQMGYFFVRRPDGVIDAETLVNKVYFYLWNDVFKDYDLEGQKAFKNEGNKAIAFKEFFAGSKINEALAEQVLLNLGLTYTDHPEL